jgi:hypothetical protein
MAACATEVPRNAGAAPRTPCSCETAALDDVAETAVFLASDRAAADHGDDRRRHLRHGPGTVSGVRQPARDEAAFAALAEPRRRELHVLPSPTRPAPAGAA